MPLYLIGARVVYPSCNARYELYPFYNETAIKTPPLPSPPPLQSPVSALPMTSTSLPGPRRLIDLGIGRFAFVAEACFHWHRRRHRQQILNDVEEIIHMHQITCHGNEMYIVLWKGKTDKFKPQFSTKNTWLHIRSTSQGVTWWKGVWFSHSSPKFSFCTWLAVLNRLSTGDHMITWNAGASGLCEFCPNSLETRNHMFFTCIYTSGLWTAIAKGIFGTHFSTNWLTILGYISNLHLGSTRNFLVRYVFRHYYTPSGGKGMLEDMESSLIALIF